MILHQFQPQYHSILSILNPFNPLATTMKFLQTAAYALMASQLTAAAPLTETDSTKSIIEFRTPNDAYAVKAALEQRTNVCRRIGTTLRTIGTSHAV